MTKQIRYLATPILLTALIVTLDQITKLLVIRNVPMNTVGVNYLGDFFWIVHTRNLGIAFSIGNGLPPAARRILFILIPVLVMVFVSVYYFRAPDLTLGMRWAMAGILGGGIGNIIDRIVRQDGVVDFLSFKFYGIFGLSRWPAFNIADMSVVVSGILLVVLFMLQERRIREQKG
ncbi:MAG: signal peptidase II [Spirochaetales bacterium]|nr:signal peptidase II [Spirochaetales bacterium]